MNARQPTAPFHASRPIVLAVLLALGALGATACQSTGGTPLSTDRADLSQEITATAVVVDVDHDARLLTLRNEDGSLFAVEAGPAVRNFEQIAPGDQLSVRYRESLTATRRPTGESVGSAEGMMAAARAMPGEKPAGGVGVAVSVRVRIESVDRPNHIVVFSLSSGELRSVRAQRSEGQAFVDKLEIGDIVQLDYTASLALAIEKE